MLMVNLHLMIQQIHQAQLWFCSDNGGVGIAKKLFVGDDTKIEGTTESTSKDTGTLIVEGGVGIEKEY